MNLLDYYIKEIISEEELPDGRIKAVVKSVSWGAVGIDILIKSKETWEYIKKEGKYTA